MDTKSLPHVQLPARRKSRAQSPAVKTLAGVAAVIAASFVGGSLVFRRPASVPPQAEPFVPAHESARPVEAPAEAPAEAPVEAPAEAPAEATGSPAPIMASAPEAPAILARIIPARALPAWAQREKSQVWIWPKTAGAKRFINTFLHRARASAPAAGENAAERKLVGWFPDNAPGRRLKFATRDADGREQEEFEAVKRAAAAPGAGLFNLEQVRALELKALMASKGAAAAEDMTKAGGPAIAKLTYADGHVEVIHYDPLVFDLKGQGVKTDSRKVLFDLFGYAKTDKLQWMNDINEGAGILVFDSNSSGRSGKNGSEVFGDRTDLAGVGRPDGFADGFAALRALVKKAVAEHVLTQEAVDGGVLEEGSLAALEKAYGLRLKVGGLNRRTLSLSDAGIKAISLSDSKTERIANFDGRSNDLVVQPGAVFLRRDGTTGNYMNIWLRAGTGAPGLSAAATP